MSLQLLFLGSVVYVYMNATSWEFLLLIYPGIFVFGISALYLFGVIIKFFWPTALTLIGYMEIEDNRQNLKLKLGWIEVITTIISLLFVTLTSLYFFHLY